MGSHTYYDYLFSFMLTGFFCKLINDFSFHIHFVLMKDFHYPFLLKFLISTHAFSYLFLGIKFSGYVLIFSIFISFFHFYFNLIDQLLIKIIRHFLFFLMKIALSITYVTLVIPLSLLLKRDVSEGSTFLNCDKDEQIDFNKMW